MATSNLGSLLKEARTKAGMTQEQLAKKVSGVSAADISKAERGEGTLSQDALKKIAKATGVTQASLLNAAKAALAKTAAKKTSAAKTTAAKTTAKTAAKKTSTAKTSAAKTAAKKTSAAKTTAKAAKKTDPKTPASAGITMRVTQTEKRLIEAYREADGTAKKNAMALLKGESQSLLESLTSGSASNSIADGLSGLITNLFSGKK